MPIPWELLTWSSKPGSRKKTFCRGSGDDLRSCIPTDLANLGHWKEKGSTSLPLLSDQSIWIKYYHCDLAWSSNQCGLFAQLFCCNASSMSSCVGIWSRIYIILPLRLTSSAATLSKRCCGFQATAVTGLPRSRVHGLDSVSMCLSVICHDLPGANLVHIFHNVIHKWKLYKGYIRIDIIKKFHDFWNHLSTR